MATGRRIVALLVLVAFLPACASSRVGSARTLDDAPSASPEVCATGDGDALRAGLLEAAALGTWWMLRGAVYGGVKDGTWIGAVVGLVARASATRDGLELAELKTLLPAD